MFGRPTSAADAAAIRDAKRVLRRAVQQRREVRPDEDRAAFDHARFEQLRSFLGGSVIRSAACYLSQPPEPSSLELISWLAAQDVRILLPVMAAPAEDDRSVGEPDWAPYAGPDQLRTGRFSIIEPTTEPVGAAGLAEAELIIAPALAANERGQRLGRGGGWYDRALAHADPAAVSLLLLNDDEVLEVIPVDSWDRRIDVIVTPTRVINCRA
jgi:5-formyltetrahydrofolate cyclo-ligase